MTSIYSVPPDEAAELVNETGFDQETACPECEQETTMNREEILEAVTEGKSLSGADLTGADLTGANLTRADLSRANLTRANLTGANLTGANLTGANLTGANLYRANLSCANLEGSCLDPTGSASADVVGFETDGDRIIGYRTRKTPHVGKYLDGRTYSADFFSVSDTECHPGLYLWPTLAAAMDYSPDEEIIKVVAPAAHPHHAGEKWRTRWFTVVGIAEDHGND